MVILTAGPRTPDNLVCQPTAHSKYQTHRALGS